MNDSPSGCLLVLALIVTIPVGIWWAFYSYHDCLRVGHSHTYCIIDNFVP